MDKSKTCGTCTPAHDFLLEEDLVFLGCMLPWNHSGNEHLKLLVEHYAHDEGGSLLQFALWNFDFCKGCTDCHPAESECLAFKIISFEEGLSYYKRNFGSVPLHVLEKMDYLVDVYKSHKQVINYHHIEIIENYKKEASGI